MSPPPAGRRTAWIVAAIVAILDQASKALMVGYLDPGQPVSVIPGLFDLTLVTNTGGVFGILRDLEGAGRGLLFGLLPLLAISLMIWYALSLNPPRSWPLAAIGLILGGATGNLIDRVRLGYVVDFLDAYVGRHHWPAFNLADSCICVGVAMLLIEGLLFHRVGDDEKGVTPSVPEP